jgi:multidrug resistance efflux pump
MIVFMTVVYVAFLFGLTRLKIVPNSKWTWLTIIPYELILTIGFFIPMQWSAPAGDVRTLTYSVAIVPNVAGQVTEVIAEANIPLKTGDVLFKLDPTPFEAALESLKAQLVLAETRLGQTTALAEQQAGSVYDVQSYQAQVDGLRAQIRNAQWNLDSTTVVAPSDGYVTNWAIRPGARTANFPFSPAGIFIDTSELVLGAQILQIYARHIKPGQTAEIAFKYLPGRVYAAKVIAVLQATAQGQLPVSGAAPAPLTTQPGPFFVRLALDDAELEATLPAGALGSVAIYTPEFTASHIIRKVMIRMEAIMNYVLPV